MSIAAWLALAAATTITLIILWKWRKTLAERVIGLIQKFRDALPVAREAVDRLVAQSNAQAAAITGLNKAVADRDKTIAAREAEIAQLRAAATDTAGKVYIDGQDFDELSDMVAEVQNIGTSASMPLSPKL